MEEQISLTPAPSLGSTIINVLAAPGEAFADLHKKESAPLLWVVPLIILVLMTVGTIYLFMTHGSFHQQMLDAQRHAIQKQVDEGKMPQERADMVLEQMESGGSGMFLIIGIIFGVIFLVASFFVVPLFLWLGSKFILKSEAGYGKFIEAYGISQWIAMLGAVVTIMMAFAFDSIYARPSAIMALFPDIDMTSQMHRLIGSIEVFAIWQTAVLGIAISKLSNKSLVAGMGLAFGLWVVWVALRIVLGLGG
jgi:hypothetical protein